MRSGGVTRTSLIVLRRRGRSKHRHSMNARYVKMGWSFRIGWQVDWIEQIAALKLRQKAVADASPSFENLTQYGF
jgi:hypothetical protein